jgi:hypothetical protein
LALFSLYTRIEAAINGQKAMSELTGRPGNIRIPDAAPINQNGTERANTNK